jgi:hypothetical protein
LAVRQFHMPHLHLPKRGEANKAGHHSIRTSQRFGRIEGAVEYLTVAGLLILMGAVAFGLLTASGDTIW